MIRTRMVGVVGGLKVAPVVLAAALVSSGMLGMTVSGTLSSFVASVTNSTNTAGSAGIVMTETDNTPSTTCISSSDSTNAATCSTLDLYGGTASVLSPGQSATPVVVRIYKSGVNSVGAFTLAPGMCTKAGSTSGDLCSSLTLMLTCTPVTGGTAGTVVNLYNGVTLASINTTSKDIKGTSATCVPPNSTGTGAGNDYVRFSFTVTLPSNATNAVQAQTVSQPLVWSFTGA